MLHISYGKTVVQYQFLVPLAMTLERLILDYAYVAPTMVAYTYKNLFF